MEIVPKPRFPAPEYTEDDRWRDRRLPKKEMNRKEIIEYLQETHGKNCEMKVMEFRLGEPEVFVVFTPMTVEREQRK